jgi:hypothetical protein
MSLVFGAPTYAQVEPSLRTGDVVLYSDYDLVFASRATQRLLRRASVLSTILSYFPCVSYENLRADCVDNGSNGSEENECIQTGVCRLDFESECDNDRQAAFVLQLVDETHTNASRDPNKLLSYIFLSTDCTIAPLRDFVEKLRSREARFSIRRLLIPEESDPALAFKCQRMRSIFSHALIQHCA